MAGNTAASIQSNQTFTTGVVPLVVGMLNPSNTPQALWNCSVGVPYAAITTIVTGSPTSFTILLEGTYDGTTWTTFAVCNNVLGETQFSTGSALFVALRARCTAVSGGSAPTVNVFATAMHAAPVMQSGATPQTTLDAANLIVNGDTTDFLVARSSAMFQVVTTGAPSAGAVTFQSSMNGVNWITLRNATVYAGIAGGLSQGVLSMNATTGCLISPGPSGGSSLAMRYFRANVSTNLTLGTTVSVIVGAA